jgi:hypothetical protein
MRAWGAALSAGYAALGVIASAVFHVPGSELFFGLCSVVTLVLALIAAPLLRPRRRRDDGDGGVGRPPGPDEPPPWWPDFEREFRAYSERLTSVRG